MTESSAAKRPLRPRVSSPWLEDDGTSDKDDSDELGLAKRQKLEDCEPGPTDYEGILRFASHQVAAATSSVRRWRHGPCSFKEGLARRGVCISTDYSGMGGAEMAAHLIQDRHRQLPAPTH